MKRLSQLFGIGPEFAARLERIGIRTTIDLAKANNLEQVSARSEVPLTVLREWHQMAQLEVRTSRYRRKVVASLATVTGVFLLFLASWSFQQTSFAPSDPYGQAIALYEKGYFAEAARIVDEALAHEENSADLHNLRGILYREAGQTHAARAEYKKAVELDPSFSAAWNNLGNVYLDLEKPAVAVEHYQKAIALDPEVVLYQENSARLLEQLGNQAEAEKE